MISDAYFRFAATLAILLIAIGICGRVQAADDGRQYYELRVYATKSAEQQQRINDYWRNAGVPAYNRQGIQPVGVFTEIEDSPTNKIYVLIPCDSLATFAAIPARLAADTLYQQAAADFLNAPKSNPAFENLQSSLLVAFDGMKQMVIPPPDQKPNVFELRTYLSPSENKGSNKIQMFEHGEITTMKEVGLAPIIYSRTLVGPQMPSLVYLTCAVSMEEHKKHWQGFGSAPVWKELQADPQYKDNMKEAISVMLKRTAASQL
jgi:hypothetical protein